VTAACGIRLLLPRDRWQTKSRQATRPPRDDKRKTGQGVRGSETPIQEASKRREPATENGSGLPTGRRVFTNGRERCGGGSSVDGGSAGTCAVHEGEKGEHRGVQGELTDPANVGLIRARGTRGRPVDGESRQAPQGRATVDNTKGTQSRGR
jgi:hypothetical protein